MKISETLNQIIMAAYSEANSRHHEFITPEHLLYASLFFAEGTSVINSCGGNTENLKQILEKHLKEIHPSKEGVMTVQSLGFQNVLERAVWHTTSAQKEMLEFGASIGL